MIKNILAVLFCSMFLFSCNSDDDEDDKDYSALASQKIWVYISTYELIKKCEITANETTIDLLDQLGMLTLDTDEQILVWSTDDASYWNAFLTVALPLGEDIVSSARTANKGEMIIFTFNGTSVDVTVEDALDHLDIIEKHYNGTFPSLVNPNIDSIQKEVKSLSMGVSSGE